MSEAKTYFIGWDVGGWNCDKNRKSRDSVCVLSLDEQLRIEGKVKRGNLRASLQLDGLRHDDQFDAVYCAPVAYLLATAPEKLVGPPTGIDHEEGWIWVPADFISQKGKAE